MSLPLTTAALRMAEHLIGFPPRTIHELVEELRVTRTAVVEQLKELAEKGLVCRTPLKSGRRGRPEYLYSVTSDAMTLLCPGNQHLLVPAIWSAIEKEGGRELFHKIIDDVSDTLSYGGELSETHPTLEQRVRHLVQTGGFEECEKCADGSYLLTKRTCRFHSMFDRSAAVCEVHLRTLAKIAGAEIERVAYRHDGCPCCQYRVGEIFFGIR